MSAAGEEARQRARCRLAAIGSVTSLVTHRARNRLATLRAALEVLAEGWEENLTPEYRRALLSEFDQFIGEYNLGADMVRCDFSQPTAVSARQAGEEALATWRARGEAAAIEMKLEMAEGADGQLQADRRLIRCVLFHLLRNAVEALAGREDGKIFLRIGVGKAEVQFEVSDNGLGVPARLHDELLSERRAGQDPVGLGLIVCQDAVLILGGSIAYLTPKGQPGARFRVTLPLG